MEQKKKIIGITGGVGAGKSSVLAVLKEDFGAKIILADLVAHDLMEPGSEGLKKVTEALGTSFLDPDGSVDRKALADVIFRNKDALRTMNSIIHPLVWKTMKEAAEAAEEQLVIIEARTGSSALWQTGATAVKSARISSEDRHRRKSTARSATGSSTTMGTSPISNDS